jgi:hypothetical protein
VRRTSSSCPGSYLVTQHRAFLYTPIWTRKARLQFRDENLRSCRSISFGCRKRERDTEDWRVAIQRFGCRQRGRVTKDSRVAKQLLLILADTCVSADLASSSTADSVAPSQSRRRPLTRRLFKGIVSCSYIVGWLRNFGHLGTRRRQILLLGAAALRAVFCTSPTHMWGLSAGARYP